MFLVSHSLDARAREIRLWLSKHASDLLIGAAVYFEWTICRAVIGLSKRPNKELRDKLSNYYSLSAYKDLWQNELGHLPDGKRLPRAISNWQEVTVAFDARNRLVHGRER